MGRRREDLPRLYIHILFMDHINHCTITLFYGHQDSTRLTSEKSLHVLFLLIIAIILH